MSMPDNTILLISNSIITYRSKEQLKSANNFLSGKQEFKLGKPVLQPIY